MSTVTPNPRTWTLRFKHNRTTVLLEVDPLQKLDNVRAELLHALQETHPSGKINGFEVPKNPGDIQLGRAIDRNKLSLGFVTVDSAADEAGVEFSGKGKGKSAVGTPATVGKSKAGLGAIMDCPQGAGFKNGDVVAFKFAVEDNAQVESDDIAEKWDVDIPTLEETYGEEEGLEEGADLEEG